MTSPDIQHETHSDAGPNTVEVLLDRRALKYANCSPFSEAYSDPCLVSVEVLIREQGLSAFYLCMEKQRNWEQCYAQTCSMSMQ